MKRTLKPVQPPAGIEAEYRKRIQKEVRAMEKSVIYWLRAKYRANEDKIMDSATDNLLKELHRLLRQWQGNFNELADTLPRRFVNQIRGYQARFLMQQVKPLREAGMGFNLKFSYISQKERQVFNAIVAENVNLIKSIARESLTQVEGITMRAIQNGHDLSELTDNLHEQFGVSERRAAMIARDQTAKATNSLSRQRLMDYGITRAVWMHTSAGKTYRDSHVDMDGEEYDIERGCYDPDYGAPVQPGELVNCHCLCRPIIPAMGEEEQGDGRWDYEVPEQEKPPEQPQEIEPMEQEEGFIMANSISEANMFMENRFGIMADYKGINIEIANEMNRSFYDTFEAFPKLKDNFDFVGGAHTQNNLIKNKILNDAIADLKRAGINGDMFNRSVERMKRSLASAFRVSKDTWAQSCSGEVKGISFNEVNAKNLAKTRAELVRDVKNKFHPVGCDTVKSVIDHELGHQLDDLLGIKSLKEIQAIFDGLSPAEITEKLSRYAWQNGNANRYSEFIAEAWAEYKNNPKPREIARKVGKIIEKEYRRKFGGAKR